jgi:hypothetical protein
MFAAKYKQYFLDAFNKLYAAPLPLLSAQTSGSEAPRSLALLAQMTTQKRNVHSTTAFEAEQCLSEGKTSPLFDFCCNC